MKTKRIKDNSIKGMLLIGLFTTLSLKSCIVTAQSSPTYFTPGIYVAFETSMENHSFRIQSDLTNLRGAVQQQGQSYGIIAGNRFIMGKIKLGNFSSPKSEGAQLKSSSIEISSNLNPLLIFSTRTHVIEPYITTGFEITSTKSNGTYTPYKSPPPPSSDGSSCSCSCPTSSLPPAPPSVVPEAEPTAAPVPYSGDFGATRFNAGAGVRVHIPKGHYFLNLFAEMKYGVSMGMTSSTQALQSTYMLDQTVLNVGAAIGFMKNKGSNNRSRKYRFR